ncbi:MAG: hypothetical protein KA773_23910 [Chloroflexi bacterium]|nr:hypothetical protein [Chloroflexota bacterium]
MTNRSNSRPGQQLGALKLAVAGGSLAAALLGTQLVARQEMANTAVSAPEPIVITVPIHLPAGQQAAVGGGTAVNTTNGSSSGQTAQLSLNLPPIPQAAVPQINAPSAPVQAAPITQTQSSR